MELHKYETYTPELIQSLIDNKIEESINIEFKDGRALSKDNSAKTDMSQDVSSMANSNGGIIIYGITESKEDHCAESLSFIDGRIYTTEWIEQILGSTIHRPIPDLKIFPVRFNNKIENTVYVVQIPESLEAPHMAKDSRFYCRVNVQVLKMEEYQVRALYGRKIYSQLIIDKCRLTYGAQKEGTVNYVLIIGVRNIGEQSEKEYKINVYFENLTKDIVLSWKPVGENGNYQQSAWKDNWTKLTENGRTTLYPDESIDMIRLEIECKPENIPLLHKVNFEVVLLYAGGHEKLDEKINLGEFITSLSTN